MAVRSVRGFESRRFLLCDGAFHRRLHLFKGADFDLPHAFARHTEFGSKVFQRHRLFGQAPRLEDAAFPGVEHLDGAVERLAAMIAHGLEPSEFVISKDRATPASVPFIGPFFYDYTVFVGEENFTVTEPNDMVFLDYFYKRCIAADEEQPSEVAPRNRGLIHRFFHWMTQPV